MHINYTMYGIARTGGTQTFVEIGKRLIEKGHKVSITAIADEFVLTSSGPKPKWDPNSPIDYIPVPMLPGNGRYEVARDVAELMDLMNRKPLGIWAIQNSQLLTATPHCDVNVASYFPTAYAVANSKNKSKVQFYHMQHYEPLFFVGNCFISEDHTWLAENSYRLPLRLIANCSWLQGVVKNNHGKESTLITHAIKSDKFSPGVRGANEPKKILCLGKTSMDWKGTSTLCEALALVKGSPELVMFGREANPQDLYPISYYMNPNDEQLAQLYRDCDIAVCPSWYESFPAPPLEAMSSGTPCVTTSTGVEDYCIDGWNSLVVPARNPEAMAAAINRLLNDHELYAKLIANGLETAKKFSWDITADKVEKTFLEALDDCQT